MSEIMKSIFAWVLIPFILAYSLLALMMAFAWSVLVISAPIWVPVALIVVLVKACT